jgi:ribose transport system permease protein
VSVDPELDLDPEAMPLWRRALLALSRVWIVVFLFVIVVYFSLTTPGHAFFHADNFKTIALDTSEVILLGIGETFVIITAGIDLSVGGILVVSGVAGGLVMLHESGTKAQTDNLMYPHASWAVPLGIAVAIGVGLICGFFNGLIISKLGTLGITFGAADLLAGGSNLSSVPTNFQDNIGNGQLLGIYVPVLIAAAVAIAAWILLRLTRFGRYTFAIGSNDEAVRRAGVNTDRHIIKVYALSGLVCGLASVIDLARFGTENLSAHNTDNLNAIAAVVIGGTSLFGGAGTIVGTIVGAFIPTVLQNGFIINEIDPFWQEVLVGVTIIVAVYIDQVRRRRL